MKRNAVLIMVFVMVLVLGVSNVAFAETQNKEVLVYVDGNKVVFKDAQPFVQDDRTFVPVRFPAEALGADVDWYESDKRVEAYLENNDRKVQLWINNINYKVNTESKQMDVKPFIRDARTFVPIRFISEGLGAEVEWKTVNVNGVNGIVFTFTLGQSQREKEQMMDEIMKEIQEKDTYTWNGYEIPANVNTGVRLQTNRIQIEQGGGDMELTMAISNFGDVPVQLEQVETIVSSKFGDEMANTIIDYINQFDIANANDVPRKEFRTENNRLIVVKGDTYVTGVLIYKEGF